MKHKNFFAGLILLILIFAVPHFTLVAWTVPPNVPPTDCISANDPGCALPINVSSQYQLKDGSLGITSTLIAFTNFFANKVGIGPGFFIPTPLTINPSAVLDLDGQIAIRGPGPLITPGSILTSDANGLASWGTGNWGSYVITPDKHIYNLNEGTNENVGIGTTLNEILPAKLTIKGSIAKFGNELNGTSAETATQVNLGNTSTTTGTGSTVSGGTDNHALANYSTVSGGLSNTASGAYSVVSGGQGNTASGQYSVVPGGKDNVAGGNYSFAGGNGTRLSSAANNTFAWGSGGTFTIPEAFLIFPNNSSPATGRVGIGTGNPTAKLEVVGGIKTFLPPSPPAGTFALEAVGPVILDPGSLVTIGHVLTANSTRGDAVWQAPPGLATTGGESVMYIRCQTQSFGCVTGTAVPPTCPSGWTVADYKTENSGSNSNNVRTCFRASGISQVLYLRSRSTDAPPPACPSISWTRIPSAGGSFYLENSGTSLNKVAICYN